MDGLVEGRMVHFVTSEGHRAAVITKVWNAQGTVNLFVFPDGSYPLVNNTPTSVMPDEEQKKQYSWHWIEKA